MTEKKEYRSAIRSRRFIRQAFMDLLKEKKFEKITVTDIVNRADINRSTFYAHYADVRGLVEEIRSEAVERAMAVVKEMDFRELLHSPAPFLRKLVEIANENRELYTIMGKTVLSMSQLEKIKVILVEKALELSEIPQEYLVGNLDVTTEEIVEEIATLIKSSSHTILDVE